MAVLSTIFQYDISDISTETLASFIRTLFSSQEFFWFNDIICGWVTCELFRGIVACANGVDANVAIQISQQATK